MTYGVDPRELDRRTREAMTPRHTFQRLLLVGGLLVIFGVLAAAVLLGGSPHSG